MQLMVGRDHSRPGEESNGQTGAMAQRFRDSTSWPDRWPALVRCPRCDQCARIALSNGQSGTPRFSCAACGLIRDGGRGYGVGHGQVFVHAAVEARDWRDPDTRTIRTWPAAHEEAYDLWLRTSCCGGEILWATNEAHLTYLEDYIGAELRERPEAVISPMGRRWVGKGLSFKLPDWMKAAKHRDEVMAALAELRATLPASA